jgi:tRNA 2-selenouridine synthase
VRVADRHSFDCVIDARSPSEFAIDHIPGAINCPVLDDDQRRIVGTLYKQTGSFEARRVGGAMVAENLALHLRTRFADKPAKWKPLVYCWRGGLRSGSMTAWLRLVGWDAQQLPGGYKAWRRHVIDLLEATCPQLQLRVLAGATGSAKTRVLQALAAQGHQVLDLEGHAEHKGSVLGSVPGVPQPSQTGFETRLANVIDSIDLSRPVYIEAESRRIGRLNLPLPLLTRMRESPCIEIDATPKARLSFLLRDYDYLGDQPEALAEKLGFLKELHGNEVIRRWQDWARQGQLSPLFAELMALHYDLQYARSQQKNYAAWPERHTVPTDVLSLSAIDALAQAIAKLDQSVIPASNS